MSISILNNISALTAENSMSTTQAALTKTLTQLSSGLRINSGADDAAGLSIANGMSANISALTQSGQNATNTTGLLQTADGALSQVTSLLNRAVTLATEASNNGLTSTQSGALNTEFQSIMNSINNIGANTTFNGAQVFTSSAITPFLSDGTNGNNMLGSSTMSVGALSTSSLNLGVSATDTLSMAANPTANDTVTIGSKTYTFVNTPAPVSSTQTENQVAIGSSIQQTLQNLANAVNGGAGQGTAYSQGTTVNTDAQATQVGAANITFTATSAGTTGNTTVASASNSSSITWSNASNFSGGTGAVEDLSNVTDAQAALVSLTNAINTVSQTRGNLGADINQLTAASNVMTNQVTNLQSADNGIMNADIGKTVANMTQDNILQSTGMSALQQANQAQQAVLKLLQ